ncbi:MAG TPA: LamG-like jellyroll fold domain-containing protein [Verrucomicrobiae bacterium]|nr:LamG-like jellyroll fold domain-containing protein [Verrucomicrobiae bacterium]
MKKTNQIMRRALIWSCMAIITMLMQWVASAQTLVHEYSFSDPGPTNVADSIGGLAWDGIVLTGGTNAAAGPGGSVFTGTQLLLSASTEDFVQLPPGILSNYTAVTIDAWVTLGTLPANCFLWGFGDTDPNVLSGGLPSGYNCIFCQPLAGALTISTADPSWQGGHTTPNAGSFAFATPAEIHVTAVINPPTGYIELYTNGILAGRNIAVTEQMNQISNVINYIGRSLYWADGYYDSSWDEFRIWNGALNPLQVAGCDVNGPNNPSTNYGTVTGVQLQLPYYQLVQGTHELATVMATASGVPNPVDMSLWASYSSSNTNILATTNNAIYAVGQGSASIVASFDGISSTQIVTVVQPASVLTHRYSFSDANGSTTVADSVGGSAWNGTVMTNGPTPAAYPGVFSGSQLTISSNLSEYVQLPSGIISNYNAVTIEAWVTFPDTLPGNCFFFGFGNTDTGGAGEDYIYLQPSAGHIGITGADPGWQGPENTAGTYGNLSSHSNVHIAAIFNPQANWIAVYTNGVLAGKNIATTWQLSQVSSVLNYICRSLYTGDQYMDASLDEFRIYNGALTSQGIAISDAAGPNSIPAGVTNGPGSLLSLTLQAPGTLETPATAQLKLLANYTSLNNWDIIGNSVFPPAGLTITSSDTNVLYLDSNDVLHSKYPGQATITVVYQGTTNTATITVTQSPATPSLVHRYSFSDANGSTSVADSIGGPTWNGTVLSGGTNAIVTSGAFTNGALWLNAAISNYVQLPSGILSNYTALTIEGWVTAQTMPFHAMYYAFGRTEPTNGLGYDYLFGSLPRDYTAISPGTYNSEQGTTEQDGSLAMNTPIHFVAVYDPPAGYIAVYTNGVLQSVNSSVTAPLSVVSPIEAFIGQSLYNGDPYASLALDEFRIYNGVLSPADVAASQSLGPDQVLTTNVAITATPSGGNLILSWPAAASGFTLQSRASLTSGSWTGVSPAATLVGNQWQVTVPRTSGTQFFRLVR